MTSRIITYILCGMRHPTTGLSEDDLSRLTSSSSSTTSSRSSSSSSTPTSGVPTSMLKKENIIEVNSHLNENLDDQATLKSNNNNNNNNNSQNPHISSLRFSSTYLPEIINPLEWQKSRKRKERLDSTSSVGQDRKLQRSNSEELLTQEADINASVITDSSNNALKATKIADTVIRRVSSEDFKKTSSYTIYEHDLQYQQQQKQQQQQEQIVSNETKEKQQHDQLSVDENDASLANRQKSAIQNDPLPPVYSETWVTNSGPTKDMTRRARTETSPARSQRHSPIRANGNGNSKLRDSDDSECEHERRRSSERSCKSRAPPGRKAAGVTKKNSSANSAARYLPSKKTDDCAYKYDLSMLKYERRGFMSKKVAANTEKINVHNTNDHNDNNLIDFHQSNNITKAISNGRDDTSNKVALSSSSSTSNVSSAPPAKYAKNNYPITSAQESLPWDRSVPEDQTPVLSRRYAPARHHPADSIDIAAKLSKVMPYPQNLHKQTSAAQMLADDMDCLEPIDTFRAFSSLENVRTREVMQQVIPAMMSYQSPEERLKQVNKRLTALKKKLSQMEEAYEMRVGYRPSQADRLNDRYMKNILAELSKLRKERQELKTDHMGALGMKISGGMNSAMRLEKMKSTLTEIEKSLTEKRKDGKRSETLEELTADQLVQEKTAVQHGLLYLESQYGRPGTKEERDAARPIYDRYRQLKRLVSRSVTLSGSLAVGVPELPTILEHEAMVFEFTPQQYSSNNSTETSNSPSDTVAASCTASSEDSTTTTTGAAAAAASVTQVTTAATANASTQSATSSESNLNISNLNIDSLWEQLEKAREEKKILKRTIREYETIFEEQNGRKMLKNDRKIIEETYAQYKEKKAKTRLLQALIKKHISR